MTVYCLELRSTQDWDDVRYREYTTSDKRAEIFKTFPKIQFTDSGHGIVPSVTVHSGGRRLPTLTRLLGRDISAFIIASKRKAVPCR
jgi:hypothetical protein